MKTPELLRLPLDRNVPRLGPLGRRLRRAVRRADRSGGLQPVRGTGDAPAVRPGHAARRCSLAVGNGDAVAALTGIGDTTEVNPDFPGWWQGFLPPGDLP